jgi:hypothetical protein
MMKLTSACALAAFALLTSCASEPPLVEEAGPAKIAQEMHAAMGGLENWNNTRYVNFKFQVGQDGDWRVSRSHLWDKWEGRYRLESTDNEGVRSVALFNVNTKQGKVYVDGVELPAEEAQERLDRAYGAYINDTYWLAMPWKWLEPGVNLRSVGEATVNGEACDVVELSFDQVGLTPGDVYRAFVSKQSRLMTHWEYTLQSGNEGSWDWIYADTNGLKLAATHKQADGREINMGDPVAGNEVDESLFVDPAKSL